MTGATTDATAETATENGTETEVETARVTAVDGFVEIDAARFDVPGTETEIEELLAASAFAGQGVLDAEVRLAEGGGTTVPHFGHDVGCRGDDGEYTCEQVRDGVRRFFGVEALVAGGSDHDLFGTYELADGIRFILCGIGELETGRAPRKKVER